MANLTPEQWEQVSPYLDEALDLPEVERAPWLASFHKKNPPLADLLRSLLEEHGSLAKEQFLEKVMLTLSVGASSSDSIASERSLPASIGRYRILKLLGEGGMGAVYEAEQEQPRRTVALKVIKTAWASQELIRRFEQESQVLGRLHHPGIAQIYEAGAADSGFGFQPFFAMELIHGKPLTEYAEGQKLSTRELLALMIKVCDAVEHAHQRGIIHRDLKPGNILVDVSGQPKILDFGLARVMDSDTEQLTRQTDIGQLLGTIPYMSPEQVTADPLVVDTRSDIYSLGVILYQLMAGKLPYQISRQLHEAVETIQTADPAPLSSVDRSYRGDIETIVAKALEKDKTRRYGSAAEFADDIRRYLEDRPITARPASTSYQLKKFARRHKTLVAAVAAVFLVLLAGVVVSTWEASRAQRAAATAEALNNFLREDLLAQASGYQQSRTGGKPDPDLKVRTALDRAAAKIEGRFDRQPEVEAAIRTTMGGTYRGLGLYEEARKQYERVLELQRRTFGPKDARTAKTMSLLAFLAYQQNKYADAEAFARGAAEIQRRVLGPDHPETLLSMNTLANVFVDEAKYSEAEAIYLKGLEVDRRVLGPEDYSTLSFQENLGKVYRMQGKYAEAEAIDLQLLEVMGRTLGTGSPALLNTMNDLETVYRNQGKFAKAEEVALQAVEIARHTLGPEHPDTLYCQGQLANNYQLQGKYTQAETLARPTLEAQRRIVGPEHSDTLLTSTILAAIYQRQGKYAPAEALYLQVVSSERRIYGPEDQRTLYSMIQLASVYAGQSKYTPAEELFDKSLEIQRRVVGPEAPDTLNLMEQQAMNYYQQHKFAEAGALYSQLFEIRRRVQGAEKLETLRTLESMAVNLSHQKQYQKAASLMQEAVQVTAKSGNKTEEAVAWYNFACAAAVSGHKESAFEYLHQSSDLDPTNIMSMAADDDLQSLRKDPRFAALLAKAKQQAAAPQHTH